MSVKNIWIDGRDLKSMRPRESHWVQKDYSTSSGCVEIEFTNPKSKIIEFVGQYPMIVGCISWITDAEIINAMSERWCQILVQKEDYLRRSSHDKFNSKLRSQYEKLDCPFKICEFAELSILDYSFDDLIDPIRCVGPKNHAFAPKMHHKFAVGCTIKYNSVGNCLHELNPKQVITGSYNWTDNASNSFENIVIVSDEKIARAYVDEWAQIFSFSEPLDWKHDSVNPEYPVRI